MKRFLRWHLPLSISVATASLFAWGFVTALRGGAGELVGGEAITAEAQTAPRNADQILILGDSLARGAGDESGLGIGGNLKEEIPSAEIVNLGVDGATTRDLAARVERPAIQRMAAASGTIIVSIGGNDLFREARGNSAGTADVGEVIDRVAGIVDRLREASPESRIFLIGLYDPFAEESGETWRAVSEWNARLAIAVGSDPRVSVVHTSDLFVDHDRLSRDQFHPGAEAYDLIARRIADALRVAERVDERKGGPGSPPSSASRAVSVQ